MLFGGNNSRFLITLLPPNGNGLFATCRKINEAVRHDNNI